MEARRIKILLSKPQSYAADASLIFVAPLCVLLSFERSRIPHEYQHEHTPRTDPFRKAELPKTPFLFIGCLLQRIS